LIFMIPIPMQIYLSFFYQLSLEIITDGTNTPLCIAY
jgi:hypothetical protein